MSSFSIKAKSYLWSIITLGVCVAIWVAIQPKILSRTPVEVLMFVGVAAIAGSWKVTLVPMGPLERMSSMSLGSALTFAGMLRLGPALGMMIGCVATLAACLKPLQKYPQMFFNIALTAISAELFGVTVDVLTNHLPGEIEIRSFPAVAFASLVYWFVNTGGVAVIISLVSNESVVAVWRKSFLWTAPGYFTGASISMLLVAYLKNNFTAILLMATPIALMTYQAFNTYATRAEEREKHIIELQERKNEISNLYEATIKSLALAIDAKDQYTHQHIVRVQRYAIAIAREMGISGSDMQGITFGALLHDIGKLGVPEYVLLKPGRLTPDEFEKIKKHPEIGADILSHIDFPWPVIPVVKSHHERWDGKGYPEGLAGEEIPLTARILAVADVYDAMTSSRSYRNAWPHEMVVEGIVKESGRHFDPVVVKAFEIVILNTIQEMAKEGQGPLVLIKKSLADAPSKVESAVKLIQRASSEIWALYEVAQTTSGSLGTQETLEILGRKLHAIFPNTSCTFMLKDEDAGFLRTRTAIGFNREFFVGSRTVGEASASLQVFRTGKTQVSAFDPEDLLLNGVQSTEWIQLKSSIIAPIVHEGHSIGTVNLYHQDEDAFGSQDKLLLESIAERAGMAIYNANVFERTKSDAVTDPLTGLYNLRYITQYVEERCLNDESTMARGLRSNANEISVSENDIQKIAPEQERRLGKDRTAFALLCLDLDSFKPINDNFGHRRGDQVLIDLTTLFRTILRDDDIVARYGGDEFLIVLQGAGPAEADALATRIRQAVENYDPDLNHANLGPLRLSVSIGYACYPLHATDCASLLSTADAHMYSRKAERKLERMARSPGKVRVEEIEILTIDAVTDSTEGKLLKT